MRNADGSASFDQVEAKLRGSGLSSLDGKSLDSILNLSEMTGLQTTGSNIVFSGFSTSRFSTVRLYATFDNASLTMAGGDLPPCCDFFQHRMRAVASIQAN